MKNILAKIGSIFKSVGKIVVPLMLMLVLGIILFAAYIVFAPDEWPKLVCLSFTDVNGALYSSGCDIGAPISAGEGQTTSGGGETTTASETPQVITVPQPTEAVVVMAEPGNGLKVETGTKIVNLADPGGRRFLKATIVIEVAPPLAVLEAQQAAAEAAAASAGKGGGEGGAAAATEDPAITQFNEEMTQRMPIINDGLVTVLSSKTYEEIYTVAGKDALKDEIIAALNETLPELHVIAVYFTEFVVQ